MDYVVYVLYSRKHNKIYIGYTGDLIQRIYWHNHGNKGYTRRFRPWEVAHVEFYQTKTEALNREKALKGGQGRAWIKAHFNKECGFISAYGGREFKSPSRH